MVTWNNIVSRKTLGVTVIAKSKSPLSKRVLSAWDPSPKDPYLWDAIIGGFGVRQNANGSITALLGYKNKYGQRRRYKLGRIGTGYTIAQARRDAESWIADIKRGSDPLEEQRIVRDAPTLNEILDEYLQSARFDGKAESTKYMDHSRIRRHIRPLLGNLRVEQISRDKVRRFFRDVEAGKTAVVEKTEKARGKARVTGGTTVGQSCLKLMSAIFTWAVDEGMVESNPCRGVRVGQARVREAILETPQQYKSLFDALSRMQVSNVRAGGSSSVDSIPDAAANAIRVLAFTGARKSEITEARWSWVDLEVGTITVPPTAHKSGHRTGKPKVIPLPSAARAIVAALPAGDPDQYLFPATRGDGGISLPSKMWVKIRKEANLPEGITNHSLRHSLGTIMAVQGAEAAQIMAALGHSQLSTTQRYIHFARDARAQLAEKYTAEIATAIKPKATVMQLEKAQE